MENTNAIINKLRSDYAQMELNEKDISTNPFVQFEKWMNEALKAEVAEPHAMMLATVDSQGKPSARIVLLRGFSADGFIFYTNYTSKKGKDINHNPHAAITFFWPQLERQIRIEGTLQKVDEKTSEDYFASRPRESKIGAWVSEQSQKINSREELENRFIELSAKYPTEAIPRPSYWGGYQLKPTLLEFWQGRPSRLHDRIQFQLINHNWQIQRIAP